MTDDAPLARESDALREYWALRASPVFRGRDVPRGDGRQVLVIPGLFGNDFYLNPIRTWLQRIGYTPRVSRLLLNAGCPQKRLSEVERSLAASDRGGPVAIVGHSRGGMLGKALASRLGERCSHLITLGSPVGSILRGGASSLKAMARGGSAQTMASQQVADAGRRVMRIIDPDCDFPDCDCAYSHDLLAPLGDQTRVWAIYSADDPVVSPSACPIDGARNVQVSGTHGGLVFNVAVFPHIAEALAS